MNQWGEAGLVVDFTYFLVFPVFGLCSVIVDCLEVLVNMRFGYRVDHGYIEVVSIIVSIVICDVGSQDLHIGVRVVFVWAGVGGGVDFVEERGFFADVGGVNATGCD